MGWHFMLALLMLLAQQTGLRHSLKHAVHDEGAATHAVCLECLAHHANDHSATPIVPVLALAGFDHVLTEGLACAQCGHGFQAGYLPRAPPAVFSA